MARPSLAAPALELFAHLPVEIDAHGSRSAALLGEGDRRARPWSASPWSAGRAERPAGRQAVSEARAVPSGRQAGAAGSARRAPAAVAAGRLASRRLPAAAVRRRRYRSPLPDLRVRCCTPGPRPGTSRPPAAGTAHRERTRSRRVASALSKRAISVPSAASRIRTWSPVTCPKVPPSAEAARTMRSMAGSTRARSTARRVRDAVRPTLRLALVTYRARGVHRLVVEDEVRVAAYLSRHEQERRGVDVRCARARNATPIRPARPEPPPEHWFL